MCAGRRLWSVSPDGTSVEADCRELRRGPQGNKPHNGPIDFLVMPRDGQVLRTEYSVSGFCTVYCPFRGFDVDWGWQVAEIRHMPGPCLL